MFRQIDIWGNKLHIKFNFHEDKNIMKEKG